MKHFDNTFNKFFIELDKNNNKDWFDENRKTYEKAVKKPFTDFVQEMINRIQKHEPDVKIKPSDAIMRINNDIRFSKDKKLYKTHVAANISPFGKKDKGYPGFYFQLSPKSIGVYGGAYMVETATLHKIRQYMADNLEEFSKAYNDKQFVEKFGTLQGEQHKRIPPEFREAAEKEPLVANKQFYYAAELKPELITSAELPDTLMDYFLAGKKVNDFLRKAME